MSRRAALLPLALALLLAAAAHAEGDAGEGALWDWLAAQRAAAGAFEQQLYDERGALLERSSGHYAILRPGYFRWQIEAPDRQLLLLADGILWHYDLDLATATRRSAAADEAFAPLQLLGGDIRELQRRFAVETLGPRRYRLRPTWPQAGFDSVELAWEAGQLRDMTVIDRSGQRLELRLAPQRPPPALGAGDFAFTPPPGVDVFIEEQP